MHTFYSKESSRKSISGRGIAQCPCVQSYIIVNAFTFYPLLTNNIINTTKINDLHDSAPKKISNIYFKYK